MRSLEAYSAAGGSSLTLAWDSGALLLEDQLVAMGSDGLDLSGHGTGTSRDQAADDHVLLEALEGIDLAVDRRLA